MSEKVRVHEIAKELGITSKDVVTKAQELGLEVKSASSSVSIQEAQALADFIMSGESAPEPEKPVVKKNDAPKKDVPQESKKEPKAEPKPAVEAKPAPEVDQGKKVEAPKADPVSKPEPLEPAVQQPQRVSRLKIVKKRSAPQPQEVASSRASAVSSYGKLSAEALEELSRKKRPKSQPAVHKKHDQGMRLDIFGDGLSDVSMDMDEDQVVLLDLHDLDRKEIVADEPRKTKTQTPVGRNSKIASTFNQPQNRSVSRKKRKKYTRDRAEAEVITHVEIPEDIRLYEFAEKLAKPLAEVIKVLFNLGVMKMKNDFLSNDEIEILSEEFGVEVSIVDPKDEFNYVEDLVEDEALATETRPPVITIMGHVDHGKTSLLDAIRKAKTAQGEAGGITQHIGAYTITQNGKPITFLDTPGHAAFSAMRQRGTDVTDIIIVVVAADDGVKAQTKEVVSMAKESGAPIIVAMNKMDKESANPDMVKTQMAELGLTPIEWGGDIEFVPISAKAGMGIDDLLENILLTAEVMDLRADPKAMAKATVVESSLEKGRGAVATVIVQNGTLRVGDHIVCGSTFGRVKSMLDENGAALSSVTPSHAAVIVGLNDVPAAGEILVQTSSDKEARNYAQKRREYDRHKELSLSTKSTLEDMTAMIAEGKLKTLKVVLKTDVHGSLEAIKTSLDQLRNEEVKVSVISSGVGGITENDVELVASGDNAILLGFNVRPTGIVKALAKQRGVDIKTYYIIYELLDDVTNMLTGMMAPKYREENTGQADVRDTFKTPKGMIAGCFVVDGKLIRGGLVRVIRSGVVIHEGELTSLKRFKDDASEVGSGYECGVMIKGYDDVAVGDVIETFKKIEQEIKL